jgi:CheY-like chemotaxis protein
MILFVDDETREVRDYVEELEISKYEVIFVDNVDEALLFLREKPDKIDLLILDIMMPPGSNFEKMDTQIGLRTGICFYNEVRSKNPDLWVLILTNVSDEEVAEEFRDEKYCEFLRKEEFLPLQLVEKVKEILPSVKP